MRVWTRAAAAAGLSAILGGLAASATPVQVSLWSPVQVFPEEQDVRGVRLDLLYGKNRDVYGIDLGVANRATRDFGGIQAGLFYNRAGLLAPTNEVPGSWVAAAAEKHDVRTLLVMGRHVYAAGTARGLQLAGGVNQAVDLSGFQVASLGNVAVEVNGGQLGGLMNVAHRHVTGFQASLFGNMAAGNVVGVQLAGLGNQCRGRMTGLQASGLFNEAAWIEGMQIECFIVGGNRADVMRGLQVSTAIIPGGANNEARKMDGWQIGLVFNRAEEIHGVQIGLANYARRMTGVQIGLLNIVRESTVPFFPLVHISL